MIRFAATIFTSAFLLFQVQPLIARYILPWFGGTPAVWSTCMLFFQMVLLAGYAYAHLLSRLLRRRGQVIVHLVLLVLACLMLPIIPTDSLRPTGDEDPVFQILLVLTATIGLPYFVVSTTGPLLQSWFAQTYPGRSPYRLFALSNFGSLVALLTYPFVFEPYLKQVTQAVWWSLGFGVFALLCGWSALGVYALPREEEASDRDDSERQFDPDAKPADKYSNQTKPTVWRLLLWIGLSMVPSVLLLATTNQVCQEIAVVPFLWVLPLALYLVTFIICFEAPYLYVRFIFFPLFAASVLVAVVCLHMGISAPMWLQASGLISAFFFGSMVCHGELACNKPNVRYLTLYYLAVSLGGALGGVFVVLIAPNIFDGYLELHVGLVLAILLSTIAFHSRTDNAWFRYIDYRISAVVGLLIAIGLCIPVLHHAYVGETVEEGNVIKYRERDFWGILTVKTTGTEKDRNEMRRLLNGRINHGNQYIDERWELYKTTYYCEGSGVGMAIERHPKRMEVPGKSLKIGVIGLGTGTIAAWGQTGDQIRFYEINPKVKYVAENIFTYLEKSREKNGVQIDVVLGDARIQMQRQLDQNEPQRFDVIAVDAFSSDAIPRHLLTLQCVELYEKHLSPGGIIAIHISNRFLDLEGICHRIGIKLGYDPILIDLNDPEDAWGYSNTWVLLTRNEEFINDPTVTFERADWEIEWRKRSLENFIEKQTEQQIDLDQPRDFDFAAFKESLDKDDQETFVEQMEKYRKAKRQYSVLWEDDFGSLWQVIRMEFDLEESWNDVKEWWDPEEDEEGEEESDDEEE